MAAICLWNLNGITAIAFGESRQLSVVILLAGLIVLVASSATYRLRLTRTVGAYIVFSVAYLLIAGMSRFEMEVFVSQINSIFVVAVMAIGTTALVSASGLRTYLFRLQLFVGAGALTVLLSPYLQDIYRRNITTNMISNVGRWSGFFGNPNEAGMACIYALLVCIAASQLFRKSRWRYISPVLIGVLLICVMLTFSRSAMFLFLLVGGLYLGISFEWNRKVVGGIFFGLLMAVVAYWFFTDGYELVEWEPAQKQRIQSVQRLLSLKSDRESDYGYRGVALEAGLAYWSRSPIMGHGLGSMRAMPGQYFSGLGCHNVHLLILGESGLIGASVYLAFILVIALETAHCSSALVRRFCYMMLLSIALIGVVDHGLFDHRNVNVLLGITFGLLESFKLSGKTTV